MDNNFKKLMWEPVEMFFSLIGGAFRLPFIVISDYRYEHNPEYREKIDRADEERDAREQARIDKLKSELNNYIQEDLFREKQ